MRLEADTQAEALAIAASIHASLVARSPSYAESVSAGRTTAWANPYLDGGKWFVNCKGRCLAALTSHQIKALKPLSDSGTVLAVKSLLTTGSIGAGSRSLTVDDNPGFAVGDRIIVEVGGEAGAGLRGTKGVGGTWPALFYPNAATRSAATPANNTYAWDEDTGDIYRYVGGKWIKGAGYYTEKAIPRALVTRVIAVSGLVLTLANTALVSSMGARVHFDNAAILNAWGDQTSTVIPSGRTLILPDGEFAVSDRVQFQGKRGWTLRGGGTILSPDGVPSAFIRFLQCENCTVAGINVRGNARQNGFGLQYGLSVTETSVPQGDAYPRGVVFHSCKGGLIYGLEVTDVFQLGIGGSFSNDVWAANCAVYVTEPLRQYLQWMLNWADCSGGGAVDCVCDSAYLTAGIEIFRSGGVSLIRPATRNASLSVNSSGDWLIEDLVIKVDAGAQFDAASFSKDNPLVNINSNIQPPSPAISRGGAIRLESIVQAGAINDAGNILSAVIINFHNPNVSVFGGRIEHPDTSRPVATGVLSTGARTLVDGVTVIGANANAAWGNIKVPGDGVVRNSTADKIIVG